MDHYLVPKSKRSLDEELEVDESIVNMIHFGWNLRQELLAFLVGSRH